MKTITVAGKELSVTNENVTTITKDIFEEAFPLTFSTKEQKVVIRLGIIISLVGILCFALKDVLHSPAISGLPFIVTGIFIVGYGLWLPKRIMKQKFNVLTKLNEEENLTRRMYFSDDCVDVYPGFDLPLHFSYEDIQRCEETEHLYVLFSGKQAIIIDKNGFK